MMQSGGRSGRLLVLFLGCVVSLLTLFGGAYAVTSSDKVRSAWSAGVKWGSGTPSGARTDAYWLPDTREPTTGRPFPDVAIAGALLTDSLQSASWTLGISDFLADLSPNTATLSFVGQVTAVPGDDVVITSGLGVQWVGRVDTVTQTRDTAGDWWTNITATDRIGALGAADLTGFTFTYDTVEQVAESIGTSMGVTLDVVDESVSGLVPINSGPDPYSGSALSFINEAAKSTNVMLATKRTGKVGAVVRESVSPSSSLTLSGVNAPQTWSLATSIDVDINLWSALIASVGDVGVFAADTADIATYGAREYSAATLTMELSNLTLAFYDWYNYGGSQRPTASGTFVVSDWSQTRLILLDPFEWVTESGTEWQVMSVQHNVSASPHSWTVSITADNLLSLL